MRDGTPAILASFGVAVVFAVESHESTPLAAHADLQLLRGSITERGRRIKRVDRGFGTRQDKPQRLALHKNPHLHKNPRGCTKSHGW
jgi:hypothetical protein